MRKVSVALTAFAAALTLTTSASGSASSPALTGACAKGKLALQKDGMLTIGTDNPAYPPWFDGGETKGTKWKINDPAKGKGFESAVAYAVAKQLGFTRLEVRWVVVPFNNSFKPGKKSFDVFVNQVSCLPEL